MARFLRNLRKLISPSKIYIISYMTNIKFTHAEKKAFLEEYKYDTSLMNFVKENPTLGGVPQWNWAWLSINPNITMKDVLENPDKNWNWDYLSENPNVTMKDVLENPDKLWDWEWLSSNPNITIKDVLENPDKNCGHGSQITLPSKMSLKTRIYLGIGIGSQ